MKKIETQIETLTACSIRPNLNSCAVVFCRITQHSFNLHTGNLTWAEKNYSPYSKEEPFLCYRPRFLKLHGKNSCKADVCMGIGKLAPIPCFLVQHGMSGHVCDLQAKPSWRNCKRFWFLTEASFIWTTKSKQTNK